MREIEFRAWDDVLSKMIYSTIEQLDDSWMFRFDEHFETETPIYLQYTGAKDKNDVKIFEGDLLREARDSRKEPNPVVFYEFGFVIEHKFMRKYEGESFQDVNRLPIYPKSYVVVGNIYDNPELLIRG